MRALINGTKVALLLLGGAGLYFTWIMAYSNGTVDMMIYIRDFAPDPKLLPGTDVPIKQTYTGIGYIDYRLSVLDVFFWGMLDGSNPSASLFCYQFVGQVFSGWALLIVESMRAGNSWKAISFITVWGFLIQNMAYAVIAPMFLIMHLSTSPTVFSNRVGDFAVNTIPSYTLPIAMTLGYVLPTILMCLPAPSILSHDTKQDWMALWQQFPIWVSSLQLVLGYSMSCIGGSKTTERDRTEASESSRKALRSLYVVLIIVAGTYQISALTLVATSETFPHLFASGQSGLFNFSKAYVPQAFTPTTKMPSIANGALLLLQFDHYIGSGSIALWATVLLLQGHQNQRTSPEYLKLALYGSFAMALIGPSGCAVACIWARDELLHQVVDEDKISQ